MARKTILVTGCSSGIGLASARLMKAKGWRVFATARTSADLERLEIENGLEALHLELTDPGSIATCADEVLARTDGQLFALFNNAAYGQVGAVEDVTADLLRHQLEINLIGTHDLTQRFIPGMRDAGEGRIVQCSSILGMVSAPYRGAYCASKFALEALSDSMRWELADTGIHVSLIEPGPIATNFVANALLNFRKNIDVAASPHSAIYESRLKSMEAGGKKAFKLPAERVAVKLQHAVESARPKRRYYVTTPTYLAAAAKRMLPANLLDLVLSRGT